MHAFTHRKSSFSTIFRTLYQASGTAAITLGGINTTLHTANQKAIVVWMFAPVVPSILTSAINVFQAMSGEQSLLKGSSNQAL